MIFCAFRHVRNIGSIFESTVGNNLESVIVLFKFYLKQGTINSFIVHSLEFIKNV